MSLQSQPSQLNFCEDFAQRVLYTYDVTYVINLLVPGVRQACSVIRMDLGSADQNLVGGLLKAEKMDLGMPGRLTSWTFGRLEK